MSDNAAELVGQWLVYIGVSVALGLLFWKLDWSTILWIVGAVLAAGLAMRFTLNKSK